MRKSEPSLSTMLDQYQEAGLLTALAKIVPSGWIPVQGAECSCERDHDAVVMCRRTVDDGDHGTEFVVWWVDMTHRGCYHGHYTDDQQEALVMYEQRRRRLA